MTRRTTRSIAPAPLSRGSATVRMYNAGLGECFLLSFVGGDGRPRYAMIDCGIYRATPNGAERMRRIVKDVAETTGKRLDVLVVTHAHWDHVSGFDQAQQLFQEFSIG